MRKKEKPPTHRCTCGWEGTPRRRPGYEPMCARCGQTAEPIPKETPNAR